MLDRVEMQIVDMMTQVRLIAYAMLPEAALPYGGLPMFLL